MLKFSDGSNSAVITDSMAVGLSGRPSPRARLFVRDSDGVLFLDEEFISLGYEDYGVAREYLMHHFPGMREVA